jgi:hypothetical protein
MKALNAAQRPGLRLAAIAPGRAPTSPTLGVLQAH